MGCWEVSLDSTGGHRSLPKEVTFKLKPELQSILSRPHEDLGTEHLREQPNAKAWKWDRFGTFEMHSANFIAGVQALRS